MKFSYKFTSDEDIFYDLLSHTQSLFNAFLFKIVDLNYGLISSINSKSYSSSIVISRTIFEVISMVFYVNDKLEKQLKIKDLKKFNTYYVNKIKKYRDDLRVIQYKSNCNYKTLEEENKLDDA